MCGINWDMNESRPENPFVESLLVYLPPGIVLGMVVYLGLARLLGWM